MTLHPGPQVPDWIDAPGDLPPLGTALEIADEAARALRDMKQNPLTEDCIYLPCEASEAITRLIREVRHGRRLRDEDDSMPMPVLIGDLMASCRHRIALDAADAAQEAVAMTEAALVDSVDVGFQCSGLKVIERVIESIPPEEIVALRKRLAAEGKLEKRTIKAVIRTGED